jgi:hypothetical protein
MGLATAIAGVGLFVFGVGFDLFTMYQFVTGSLVWTPPTVLLSLFSFSGAVFGIDYAVKYWSSGGRTA